MIFASLVLLPAVREIVTAYPRDTSLPSDGPLQTAEFDTNYRSALDIVWTCFLTIFACTWLSVHPNIVGYRSTWKHIIAARVELMLWSIFGPELIVVFAFRQWSGARRIKAQMNILARVESASCEVSISNSRS